MISILKTAGGLAPVTKPEAVDAAPGDWSEAAGAYRRAKATKRERAKPETQGTGGGGTEVVLACNILNQMTGLGRPMSHRIGW